MDKSDLRIEQLQQYLDKKKGVVESDIKEYNQQLGKNYLHFFDWHADDLYKACYRRYALRHRALGRRYADKLPHHT